MAYVPFDSTKPADTQTGSAFATSDNANQLALWHAVTKGNASGWTRSVVNGAGTAEEPQYVVWSNGTLRVRATYTYSAGYATSILKEYSSDSGTTPNATGTWSTIDTETASYDGSGNMTGGANSSFASWLYEWIGKFKALRVLYLAHVAATGTAVHGLGSMSTQSSAAVAVTGGTVKGVTLGGTGASEAQLASVIAAREKYIDMGSVSGTVTLDLATGTWFRLAPSGNFTIAWSNLPTSGWTNSIIIEVVNGSTRTMTLPSGGGWGAAGVPAFTANTDFVQVISRDAFTNSRFIYGSPG